MDFSSNRQVASEIFSISSKVVDALFVWGTRETTNNLLAEKYDDKKRRYGEEVASFVRSSVKIIAIMI